MNSTSNFDLNIGNYSKTELEEILELPMNYDESIIQMKENKLKMLNGPKNKNNTIKLKQPLSELNK